MLARPANDMGAAAPVVLQGGTLPVVTTVSTVTAVTGGGAAEDAAAGTNPLTVGGVVRTATAPTTLVAGDAARLTMTSGAAAVMQPYGVPEVTWQNPAKVGGHNDTTPLVVKEAAGAGLRNYVTEMDIYIDGPSTAVDLRIREPDITCASQTISSNTLTTSAAHGLSVGDSVVFTASTVTGITANTVTYYVLTVPSTTTLTLSTARGGSTLSISGTSVTATFHKYLWMTRLKGAAERSQAFTFPVPLRGSPNVNLQIFTSTNTVAPVYVNMSGFVAA